jgi:hypothetical protein
MLTVLTQNPRSFRIHELGYCEEQEPTKKAVALVGPGSRG